MSPANPFYHRTPIRNSLHFFGREQERQQIGTLLANGQSVSVIGPRRIGKSSLLHQLCQPTLQAAHGPTADTHTIVYFSGEGWQDQPAQVLYGALWAAIRDVSAAIIAAESLSADLPDATGTMLDFPTFQRALRRLGHTGQRLILLLDEFDALSRNRNLDEVFFSSLRSLAATQGVIFVTASTAPLLDLTYAQQSALSSPFFNIFLPQRVGLLSLAEAHDLLQGTAAIGGLELTQEQQEQLLSLAGPHPCFLQIAGYHFWEAQQVGLAGDVDSLQQAFADETEPHWAYQWRYLTPEEQRTLALLPAQQPSASTLQMRLQQSCLVQGERTQLTYLSPLFHSFIQQQQVHQILQAGPLLLDQQTQRAWLLGQQLILSPQDYRLLTILATDAGQTLPYGELAQRLWPEEATVINQQTRLKTAISSLRRKLGEQEGMIVTDASGG
ncbi:MAG: AAA family ATPase, partial [Caldilineaceae bacterium]|nr:AAA family ATPase [Caldilineaceae bacterium]